MARIPVPRRQGRGATARTQIDQLLGVVSPKDKVHRRRVALTRNDRVLVGVGVAVATLARILREHPRTFAGLAFGIGSGAAAYFSWTGSARGSGSIVWLCSAVALSHAVFGAAAGERLVRDSITGRRAFATGGLASAAALVLFTPAFASWISASNTSPRGVAEFVAFVVLVGVSTLLAGWWGLILLSAVIGGVLHAVAHSGES